MMIAAISSGLSLKALSIWATARRSARMTSSRFFSSSGNLIAGLSIRGQQNFGK